MDNGMTRPSLEMMQALEYYADTFCELGKHHECCGRMSKDECSGCFARAILAKLEKTNER